jgi:hypothetical protein
MQLPHPHARTWNAVFARGWQVNPGLGATAWSDLNHMPQRSSEITSDAFGSDALAMRSGFVNLKAAARLTLNRFGYGICMFAGRAAVPRTTG